MRHQESGQEDRFRQRQARYWSSQEHSARRDPRDPVIRAYSEPKIQEILSHMSLPESPRILDVGSGNGYFSYYWRRVGPTIATDYSMVMLVNHPMKRKGAMDACRLAFTSESFDVSFCHALLHHVSRTDRIRVMREMARVSRRYVVLIEPNRSNPIIAGFSLLKREEHGGLDFSLRYSRWLAQEAGLRVIRAVSWGLLTPNRMPMASKLTRLFTELEKPLRLGVTNIVIADKERTG